MPAGPSCAADLSPDTVVCPRCSSPTPWSSDVTHLADAGSDGGHGSGTSGADRSHTPVAVRSPARTSTRYGETTSWATTSDIDHGRFAPGTMLDERYRVIGRL